MSNLPEDQVWIPGKAYEILIKAPFMKSSEVQAKAVKRALLTGERKNKGRGYRVLCTLSNKKSCFLAAYMHEYLASPAYGALGTADALAARTLTDRLDEMCAPSQAQLARQENLAKGREVAAANREAAREPKIEAAKAKAQAYGDWCKRDAFITQQRGAGLMLPREPMPIVTAADWKTLDDHAPNWRAVNTADTITTDLSELVERMREDVAA
jgi:hypothetical protein